MNSRRYFQSTLTALFTLTLSAGLLFAQDQSGSAVYDPSQSGYGQEQGGYPAPPPSQGYPAAQQGYPAQSQQGYPGQPEQGAQQQQDPPGRVARLQYQSGEVSMQPGGVNDWIAATQNRPLTTSDRIWTDKNSRAELNVGDGFIRMNSETSVTLTNVNDSTVQLEVDQGTLDITVRHLEQGEVYEVDTPNYAFTVMKPGVYRFDVYPSEDQSWVTVRKGYGEATGRGAAVRVNSGEQVRFTSSNSLQHTAEAAPARDGFDDWAQVRDKRLDDSLSARYVSPGVIGYQDLDGYGQWQSTPAYGNVWVPTAVPAGWAPYRFGHWAWIAPWGWTWVDDAPWGFAPFHYGRWVTWGGGWAWAPGPIGYWNPYYAPALVGWIGGPGFGVGFGFGGGFGIGINFGWFPLGWGEPYFPHYCGWGHGGWYRGGGYVSNAYFRNVNITNTRIVNINNFSHNYYGGNVNATHYGFRDRPGAVTAAPGSAITSGAAINRVGGAVPTKALGQGTMLRGVSMNPTHTSVLGGNAPQTRGVPPASAFSRSVVTANRPSATNRPANLQAANQATLAHGNLNALNHGAPTAPGAANGARPGTTGANTARVNGPQNGRSNTPSSPSASQARGPATAGTEARVDTTPTSQGGHYVPRPPSAGGVANPSTHSNVGNAAGASNGGRGTTGNNNYGRTGTQSTYGHSSASGASTADNRTPAYGNNQRYGSSNSTVPRPPQSYGSSQGTPQHSAPPSAPSHQSAPSGSKESSHGQSSHGQGAALSIPQSGHSYGNSPTYSASAGYGGSRPTNSYSSASRGAYGASPSYSSGRNYSSASPYFGNRSYGSPASNNRNYGSSPSVPTRSYSSSPAYSNRSYGSSPAYGSRSYGSSPAYSSRSYRASPTYSARSAGSYSAPRSSGGGASYHAPSGGGSHSSGGGSHSSGGGGGHGR